MSDSGTFLAFLGALFWKLLCVHAVITELKNKEKCQWAMLCHLVCQDMKALLCGFQAKHLPSMAKVLSVVWLNDSCSVSFIIAFVLSFPVLHNTGYRYTLCTEPEQTWQVDMSTWHICRLQCSDSTLLFLWVSVWVHMPINARPQN